VRYIDENGVTAYYTPEGDSFEEAFLTSPAPTARITSYFGVREHPIFHLQRQHKGIDYAAPSGTPVLAVSEGKVTSVGWQSGYGKVVEIKHSDKYSSLYAHLSKYASQLAEGQSVEKGQVIAYIGRTGVATGPHLHFELHIDGTAVNPLTAKLPNTVAIAKKYRTDFLEESKSLMAQLEPPPVAEKAVVANTDAPLPAPKQSKLAQLVNGNR
jgi:murein DD-endopeptidase MepM/ murein hydrolase activator NlpD